MGIVDTGRKIVATVGTPERLIDQAVGIAGRLDVTAPATNTGNIYIGGRDVSGVSGSENGWKLAPGDMWSVANQQIYDVWIDATVATEGVHWGAVE